MSLLDISVCILIFIVGFNLKHFYKGFSAADKNILNKLFFWHFFIAVLFNFYVDTFGGDAQYYWSSVKVERFEDIMQAVERLSATGVIQLLNYIPSNVLDLSFFTGNMMYALIGYFGFVFTYKLIKHVAPSLESLQSITLFRVPLFPWILFLPNLHFWSSGIGKDAILFFCVTLFAYSLTNIRKRLLGLALAIILSLLIRPHISLFLISAFGLGYLIDGKLPAYQKFFIFMVFLVGFASIFNYVLEFVQLESFESSAIDEYATKRSSALNSERSGSGIDISGYPYPLKVFTFLYRPLFFDINGILAIVASFENLILLILTVRCVRSNFIKSVRSSSFLIKGILIYFSLGALAFSLILGNLGIMLRQKNMFFILFVVAVLWILSAYSVTIRKSISTTTS